jgi:hypothetical protein
MYNTSLINGQRYLFILSNDSVFVANYLYKLKNHITVDKLSDKYKSNYRDIFSFEYSNILKVIPISMLIQGNKYTFWYKCDNEPYNRTIDAELIDINKDTLYVGNTITSKTLFLYDIIDVLPL